MLKCCKDMDGLWYHSRNRRRGLGAFGVPLVLRSLPGHSLSVSRDAGPLYVEDLCPRGRQARGATISWG